MEVSSSIATQEFSPTNVGELAHRLEGITICVADDDSDILALYGLGLAGAGAHVYAIGSGYQLAELVKIVKPDFLVTDCRMPGAQGWEVIETLMSEGHLPRTFLVTAHATDSNVLRVGELELVTVVKKPFDYEDLVDLMSPKEP
jgi:CheY-like chemotaxis protein